MNQMKWDKWIIEMLPIRLRTVRIFALLKVLCWPVEDLYNLFLNFSKESTKECGIMPNSSTLELVVLELSGVTIFIEEGDGKPYDFIVNTGESDIGKLKQVDSILRKYKQAGKNFGYKTSAINISCQWDAYVCEVGETNVTYKYICEQFDAPTCIIQMSFIKSGEYVKGVIVSSEKPVESDVLVGIGWKSDQESGRIEISIEKGTSEPNTHLFEKLITVSLLSVLYPRYGDRVYSYKISYDYKG